jgi:hypothetical protein
MGREGLEPSILGLRVREDSVQGAARNCNSLLLDIFGSEPKYS